MTIIILYDEKDACLDTGICKYGEKVKIENKEIIVKKSTCIDNNGEWREKYNDCIFH